jgi:type II secretory pathway pseudopilin PulG
MRIFLGRRRGSTREGRSCPPLVREDGFTLLETVVAAAVLVVGLTSLLGLLDTSLKASASTRAREGATNLARSILENARTIPYAQLSPSSIEGQLQAMHGLADASSASGWQIVQRGITYTVVVNECSIDDPKDGYGKHTNAFGENPFCSDSSTEGTADAQPADLKRITVDVKWTARGRTPDVHQVETLTAAGEAPGLTAASLHLETPAVSTPTEPVISEEPATHTLVFAVSGPPGTTAMTWSLEGTSQSPAPTLTSGTTWNFSWSVPYPGVSDGTYRVSAQAVDATGVLGPPVTIPVTLIRGVPAAVSGLRGGFDTVNVSGNPTKVGELQWNANPERNVIGYRVYAPGGRLACPASLSTLTVALSCTDFEPPSPSAPNLTYTAVALYRDANGVVQQGPPGSFALVGGPPPPPNPPTNLTLTHNADGSVTLNWSEPSGGPSVIFYRIYRGSTNYTGRYDTTGSAATTTYTDTDAEVAHSYWVTAVDANLTESSFLGPVTG